MLADMVVYMTPAILRRYENSVRMMNGIRRFTAMMPQRHKSHEMTDAALKIVLRSFRLTVSSDCAAVRHRAIFTILAPASVDQAGHAA